MANHHYQWVNQRTKWQCSIAKLNCRRVCRKMTWISVWTVMSTLDRAKTVDSCGGLHFKWGWSLFRGLDWMMWWHLKSRLCLVMSMITRCSPWLSSCFATNDGFHQWGYPFIVYHGESYWNGWELGVPLFQEIPNHPTPSIVYRPNSTQHHDHIFSPAGYIQKE